MQELEEDGIIKQYIRQILKVQEENKPLNTGELDKIASDLGLTDSDLAKIRNRFKDCLTRGQGYSRYEDWESAIEELQDAVSLNPTHVDALYGLAYAYRQRYLLKKQKEDLNNAKTFAKRSLALNPAHDASLRLISQINRGALQNQLPVPTKKEPGLFWSGINKPENGETRPAVRPGHLHKSLTNKKISGVCGGIAEYFGVDATLIRVGFLAATFFTSGSFMAVYILLSLLLPKK